VNYKQLTLEQRYHISALWQSGKKQKDIATELGVHKSTISRELKRNMFWWGSRIPQYNPGHAQTYCEIRHKHKRKRIKLTEDVKLFIKDKLLLDWSPDQISGYAKKHNMFSISHETIYQFILQNKKYGGDLYKHLRHKNKKYRKRYGSPKKQGPIKNRRFIEERPVIVSEKKRLGDWEIDTIIGSSHKQAIVSIVERVSKITVLKKVIKKTAALVTNATISGLQPYRNSVLTITGDNGSEFTGHDKISKTLNADFYFAHPYSSWERGLNENTNGLIRQYFKKGSSFDSITDDDLAIVMDKLNNRPRKTLGYATPNEVFNM